MLVALSGCNSPAVLKVEDATVTLPAVPGNPGAAYFTIKGGTRAESLISVTSPQVIRAEMHENMMENGMMAMKPLAAVDVQPAATVAFAPKGKHVMLYDIAPTARAAGTVTLTFTFASGTKLEVPAKVMNAGETGDHAH